MPDSNNSVFDNFSNLYPVTKTIRFNLLPVNYEPPKTITDEQFKKVILEFLTDYKKIISNFEVIVFVVDEYGEKVLNSKIKIRLEWLKTFCKRDFFDNPKLIKLSYNRQLKKEVKSNTVVTLRENAFLLEIFENWITKNYLELTNEDDENITSGIICELEKLNKSPLENKGRKADYSYWFHKILSRHNFDFVYSLFYDLNNVESNNQKVKDTFTVLKQCKSNLEKIQNYLRPSQSFGLEIKKTSLNYYTVEKKPRDYKKELEDCENKLKKTFEINSYTSIKFKKKLDYKDITQEKYDYLTNKLELNFKNCGFVFEKEEIEKLYIKLKNYKAEQKSALIQFLTKNKSFINPFESLKKDFDYETINPEINEKVIKKIKLSLFDDISSKNFTELLTSTNTIIDDSNSINELTKKEEIQKLKNTVTKNKIQRGKDYFDVQSVKKDGNKNVHICPFAKYVDFCELFKSIAMEYGKIKANIKSIEKEEIESQKLQSWSVLLEKNNQHCLVTIPKSEKLKYAYREISKLESVLTGNQSIWLIESLTLRALDKLCFGDNSTFKYDNIDRKYLDSGKLLRKDQFKDKNLDLIEFYQSILKLKTTKEQIKTSAFFDREYTYNPVFEKGINLEKFQSELEKACYIKKEIKITQLKLDELVTKYDARVYEITSYDLEKNRQNPELHTNIWKEFCSLNEGSGYKTRLNPEMKINYIEKRIDSILDKTGKEVIRNRRKQTEYVLSTTITEYNDKPKFDVSFKDKDLIVEKIGEFNKTLNDKVNPNNVWYYGLDRGQEELLTLGLFKFPNNQNPVGAEFEIWELPENRLLETKTKLNGTEIVAYKNISYFTELLVPRKVSCLDLTCAKLIGDKIVVNGDMSTYINLKLENAKRKMEKSIFEIANGKIKKDGTLNIKINPKKEKGRSFLNLEVDGKSLANLYYFKEIKLLTYLESKTAKTKEEKTQIKNLKSIEITSVEKVLNEYLQELLELLKNNEKQYFAKQISKIIYLRDAVCANGIGIISHLQKTHFGFICFEDLTIEQKKEHYEKWNFNLGSRVEIMLLNKFKNLGLVPPNYKNSISLQSSREIKQLGIIKYVETAGTSSNCPNCGNKIDEATKEQNKWGNHKFRCMNNSVSCGFNTYLQDEIDKNKSEETQKNLTQINPTIIKDNWSFKADKKDLDFLNTSDDVATYNIAKRGLELITNQNNN